MSSKPIKGLRRRRSDMRLADDGRPDPDGTASGYFRYYGRRATDRPALNESPIATSFQTSKSPPMEELLRVFMRVAPMSVPLLLTGESGTGKEVLARSIHDHSPRQGGPFVAVNCAALPRDLLESELFGHERGAFTGARDRRIGKFEAAGDGTLLLDEIGELPLDLQAKLLRALQERMFEPLGSNEPIPFRARLLAATSRDLGAATTAGEFRLDLFYRVAVVQMRVPALRERVADLPAICSALLDRHAQREGGPRHQLAPGVIEQLARHSWPGNIRELENVLITSAVYADSDVIKRVMFTGGPGGAEGSTAAAASASDGGEHLALPATVDAIRPLDEYERVVIEASLRAADGNLSRCARALGIARATLRRKLVS